MGNKHVRKYLSRTIAAFTLAFGALVLFTGSQVSAVTPKATTNAANTLKISPVRSDITIAPGKTGTVAMKVTNLTKAPMVVRAIENDFIAGDEKGTPALILDEKSFAPTHSLKRFMAPLQDVTVAPGAVKDVVLTIKVPATAKAGGYYGAVRFASSAADGSQSVNLNASAASLVLLTVPGDFVEQLSLTNFDVKQKGKSIGDFINTPDDMGITFRFENKGNLQVAPFGQIYVKQGDKVIYSYDFNQDSPRDTILPDSARRWDVPLDKLGTFGQYTIGATFTYGTKNKSIEVSKTIWIIPTTYIIAAVVALVALIGVIAGIVFFLRSYKRRILRTHGRGSRRH